MPTTGIRQEFDLTTRSSYTKVKAEIGLKIEGSELPNMAILGDALEAARQLIQEKVTESYKVVPERVDTEIAEPYKAG